MSTVEHLQPTADSLVKASDEATLETSKCRNCGNVAIDYNMVSCKHGFCKHCIRIHFDNACPGCETEKIMKVKKDMEEMSEKMENMTNEVEKMKTISIACEKMRTISTDVETLTTQKEIETQRQKEFENEITQKFITIEEKLSDLRTRAPCITKPQTEYIFGDLDSELELQGYTNDDSNGTSRKCPNFTWKIEGFKQPWKSHKHTYYNIFESNSYSDKETGLAFNAQLCSCTSADLIIFLADCKRNLNNFAKKFTLIDQSDCGEKKHITFTDTPKFCNYSIEQTDESWFQRNTLVPKGLLQRNYDVYVRDDSIIIKINVIPLIMMYKSVGSDNGVLLWKIDNYSKKKQVEIDGIRRYLTSNSFYTSPQGYRLQALLFLNGHDKARDEYISIYLTLVAGEFDHSLPSPFVGLAKFLLMNQSNSFKKRPKCREIWCYSYGTWIGISNFVSHDLAEKPTYLKEDSLLLKIVVKTEYASF